MKNKMIESKRIPVQEREVKERIKDFKEVPQGYAEEEAVKEAKRCLQCPSISPCKEKCPVKVDIKSFIKKIAAKDFKGAYLKIKEEDPIPAITGRVCPQEDQCEGSCQLGKIGDPINIGKLAAFIADWAREKNIKERFEVKEKGQKVAIIGSGPCSISCAVDLKKKGYNVVIFEALHKAGGVLQYGIPEFRLPRDIVDKELSYLQELGIHIKLNSIVGQNIHFRELRKEYNAIFIGTGAGAPSFLNIEGEKLNGVYSANEFLIRVNLMKSYKFPEYDTPIRVGRRVAVIGAGNVAMDAARSALRLGAKVSILYRRTKKDSPARKEELNHALEEKINFIELVSPRKIIEKKGWVKSIELSKMKLGNPDKSGRPKPERIPKSEFTMDFDTVIIAIGTQPNRLFLSRTPNIRKNKSYILVDKNLKTNLNGVYAGGDAIGGRTTVIEALGEGKKAAIAINNYLKIKKRK